MFNIGISSLIKQGLPLILNEFKIGFNGSRRKSSIYA
jgi:hypothetical protein